MHQGHAIPPVLASRGWLAMLLALAAASCTGAEPVTNGRLVEADGPGLPRLVRFVSMADPARPRTCYGQVVASEQGRPTKVLPLQGRDGFLCDPPGVHERVAALAMLNEAVALLRPQPDTASPQVELIAGNGLARIKAPVPFEPAWLENGTANIVAAGLNYQTHADETGQSDRTLFPKNAVPTPPYQAVPQVERLPLGSGERVCLLDYEVELAFVALQPIPLNTPPHLAELKNRIALPSTMSPTASRSSRTTRQATPRARAARATCRPGPGWCRASICCRRPRKAAARRWSWSCR
jgi:hypothetical protein